MLATIVSLISNFLHLILGIGTPGGKYPPPLSGEKEREYFRLLKTEKDEAAREALILHNLRLVSHIVRKYYAASPNQEDLISIGTVGLVKAVDSFSDENGAKFATYASRCIQNAIHSLRNVKREMKLLLTYLVKIGDHSATSAATGT